MGRHAELVFAGGAVYTADPSRRRVISAATADGRPASAVAVVSGRIAAIGTAADRDIQDLIGPATDVVDLRGRALLPGFRRLSHGIVRLRFLVGEKLRAGALEIELVEVPKSRLQKCGRRIGFDAGNA